MADVRPFRGLRFNPLKAGSLGRVIAPPYDIISPEEQTALYRSSPYNAVRLELADPAHGDPYRSASEAFSRWRTEGVLVQDQEPALYLARREFSYAGGRMSRLELTVALRLAALDAAGPVRPHENTRAGAKRDRMSLMQATQANISPLMLLHHGSATEQPREEPHWTADLPEGDRYEGWMLDSRELVGTITASLADTPLYIADGHHRYETSLAYRDGVHAGPEDAASFVLATLIAMSDPGLLVLPYHRLVTGLDPAQTQALRDRLLEVCAAEHVRIGDGVATVASRAEQALSGAGVLFAVWGVEPGALSVLSLRSQDIIDQIASAGHSRAWAGLSNSVFREAILGPALGLDEESAETRGLLGFCKDAREAIGQVDAGEAQIAFLCRPVTLDALKSVSDLGERLPPKSTYFYPKLPTGLVMRSLEGSLS